MFLGVVSLVVLLAVVIGGVYGLSRDGPHTPSHIRLAAMAGTPLNVLQRRLDHSTLRMVGGLCACVRRAQPSRDGGPAVASKPATNGNVAVCHSAK